MPAMNKLHRRLSLTVLALVVLALVLACARDGSDAAAGTEPLLAETWSEKASYALGLNIGSNLAPDDLELDLELLLRGFEDGLAGTEALDSEEVDAVLGELGARMQAHKDSARQADFLENTARSAAFLAVKAKEEGVVKTDSGLLYRELRAGGGDRPAADQAVTVHYRGTLLDGTEFDGTYDRDQPATFSLDRMIPGMSEALQLMQPGAKWEIFIPADLAYGRNGSLPAIPPGAALIFEVELLELAD